MFSGLGLSAGSATASGTLSQSSKAAADGEPIGTPTAFFNVRRHLGAGFTIRNRLEFFVGEAA
jgi:hypothetical protein